MFLAPHERKRSHHAADQARDGRRFDHPDPTRHQGWRSMKAEADLPGKGWDEERRRGAAHGAHWRRPHRGQVDPHLRAG